MEITKSEIETFTVDELRAAGLIAVQELAEMLEKSDGEFATYLKHVPYASPLQLTLKNSRKKEIESALSDILANVPSGIRLYWTLLFDKVEEEVYDLINTCDSVEYETNKIRYERNKDQLSRLEEIQKNLERLRIEVAEIKKEVQAK